MSSELVNTLKLQAELEDVKKELAKHKSPFNPHDTSVTVEISGDYHCAIIYGDIKALEKLDNSYSTLTTSKPDDCSWGHSLVFRPPSEAFTSLLKNGFKYVCDQGANYQGRILAMSVWSRCI